MRHWGLKGTGAFALMLTGLLVLGGAAWTQEEGRDSQAGDLARTCERIAGKPSTGGLEKTTEPAGGAKVRPGQVVAVRLAWDAGSWSAPWLHKAIDCVTVNGVLDVTLSVEEKPTLNDGVFERTLTIPAGVGEGTEVCDQGFLSGDASGGSFEQERSDKLCFTTEVGPGSSGPAPNNPAPQPPESPAAPQAPAGPPAPSAAPPAPSPQAPPPRTPAAAPERSAAGRRPGPAGPPAPRVKGEVEERPAPAAPPAPLASTGANRSLVVLGGLGLMLGGLGLVGGTPPPALTGGRRRR
jgi:hypothetical protein